MLKRSEHIARAMLLGMWYHPKLGLYFRGNRSDGEQLDALTLKPLTWNEAIKRIDGNLPENYVWYKEAPEDDT